jgi:alpha-ketoglutarate-dependent taurine dioxygenase
MKRISSQDQYVVNFLGINDVIENSHVYSEIFKKYGMVCFRNAHLDDDLSISVLNELAKHFHWSPVYKKSNGLTSSWKYTQNYDSRVSSVKISELEQSLINPWHLEGMYKKNTQHAAGWKMRNFKCDSNVGQTGFIDSSELIELLPQEMYDFLKKCKLIHYPIFVNKFPDSYSSMLDHFSSEMNQMSEQIWSVDGKWEIASNAHNAIENHPTCGYEVLRLCPCCEIWGHQHLLFSVNNSKPTATDIEKFGYIKSWLRDRILDESLSWYHEWSEGDFLVPDLFIMIHAARGGFFSGQREFDGFWCFESNVDYADETKMFRERKVVGTNGTQSTDSN